MLKIFNTLTKQKERFNTFYFNIVNMYVCGVTVYDYCHIGHGRTFTVFDMISRYLQHNKYKVNYVRNITDIDDKIIQSARINNESVKSLTNRMISCMHDDFLQLGLMSPSYEPKVTDYINTIIFFIKNLLNKNYAYIAKNGDVLFSISSYHKYGCLSKQLINKLQNNNKNNLVNKKEKYDFVLWKLLDDSNLPNWKSPWGNGRPGWHIECSAINYIYFNNVIDIHGGGSDLLFPHHENELAQSSCLYDSNYGNYWMHVGSLLVQNKKMSKSLNNTILLKSILKKYNGEILRFFFLSTHYRKPIIYNQNNLLISKNSLKKLYFSLYNSIQNNIMYDENCILQYKNYFDNFYKYMNNDFNTPQSISILFKISKK